MSENREADQPGARLRRRRRVAAVGVALLAAIVVGATVWPWAEDAETERPAPTPTAITEVPGNFPLGAGFSDLTAEDGDDESGWAFGGCPDPGAPVAATDQATLSVEGGEAYAVRQLALFADAEAAESELARLRAAADGCADITLPSNPSVILTTTAEIDDRVGLGDGGFAFLTRVVADGTPTTSGDYTIVTRVANAVVVSGGFGGVEGAGWTERDLRAWQEDRLETEAGIIDVGCRVFTPGDQPNC